MKRGQRNEECGIEKIGHLSSSPKGSLSSFKKGSNQFPITTYNHPWNLLNHFPCGTSGSVANQSASSPS